jgi:hypothetical protein
MTPDIETPQDADDFDDERPDPEEPDTWQQVEPRDAETDELDWADQHPTEEDPFPEEQ